MQDRGGPPGAPFRQNRGRGRRGVRPFRRRALLSGGDGPSPKARLPPSRSDSDAGGTILRRGRNVAAAGKDDRRRGEKGGRGKGPSDPSTAALPSRTSVRRRNRQGPEMFGKPPQGLCCASRKPYGVLNYSRGDPSARGDCRHSLSADRCRKGMGFGCGESASLNILTYRSRCIKYTVEILCDATFRLRPPFLTFYRRSWADPGQEARK